RRGQNSAGSGSAGLARSPPPAGGGRSGASLSFGIGCRPRLPMPGESGRSMPYDKIAFVSSNSEAARSACRRLRKQFGATSLDEADVVVVLGGDGTMLETLHKLFERNIPIYGMNRGTVGFLMNEFRETGLKKRLEAAQEVELHPLRMDVRTVHS